MITKTERFEDERISSPLELREQVPLSEASSSTVLRAREEIEAILSGRDDRLIVAVGPCSVDSYSAATEYAKRLKAISDKLSGCLCITMRVYVEKPRTTVGWKGLANDPSIDGSCQIPDGLHLSRQLLKDVTAHGVPITTEVLSPIVIRYLDDLVSLGMIGARTTESQIHRELVSSLPFPVGFKNGTSGSVSVAVEAMKAARAEHCFLDTSSDGMITVTRSQGNTNTFPVLRGGSHKPNFDPDSVMEAEATLACADECQSLMIDCSHGNCRKKVHLVPHVVLDVSGQIEGGNQSIVGVMFESYLKEGNQAIELGRGLDRQHGLSVTDPCVGWGDTVILLERLADAVTRRRDVTKRAASMIL